MKSLLTILIFLATMQPQLITGEFVTILCLILYDSVCGVNGITYPNGCLAGKFKIQCNEKVSLLFGLDIIPFLIKMVFSILLI